MAGITNKTFPFFLLFIWLICVIMLFCAGVYGDFDILVDTVRKGEIQRELHRITQNIALSVQEYEREVAEKFIAEPVKELEAMGQGSKQGQKESEPGAKAGTLIKNSYKLSQSSFSAELSFTPRAPDYKMFSIADPDRLVVDFPGKWTYQVQRIRRFQSGPVKKIVLGLHEDFLRLVLHYSQKVDAQEQNFAIKRRGEEIILKISNNDRTHLTTDAPKHRRIEAQTH